MARKNALRRLRAGTIINATSKEQEKTVIKALNRVVSDLATELTEDSDDNLSLVVLAIGLGLGTFLVAAMCVSWLHATLIAAI